MPDAHAAPGERGERLLEEGAAARAALVGQDRDVGVAAVVVDGEVQVVEAQAAAASSFARAAEATTAAVTELTQT